MTVKNAAGAQNPDPVQGRYTSTDIEIEAEGRMVVEKMYTVAIHASDVSAISTANENFKNWEFTFTDNSGATITGRTENPTYTRTFGYMTSSLVLKAGA